MPEDLPKAVIVLVWLLSGTIVFGALLMTTGVIACLVFALLYFGLPVLIVNMRKRGQAPD